LSDNWSFLIINLERGKSKITGENQNQAWPAGLETRLTLYNFGDHNVNIIENGGKQVFWIHQQTWDPTIP